MNELNELDSSEFDFIFELILAVLFMSIGLFAIITTIRVFAARVELTPRVDKVEINSNLIEENNPFDFTGYQAYMMAWHMDGLSEVPLMWTAGDLYADAKTVLANGTETKLATLIDPVANRSGFITYRNQMITGSRIGEGIGVTDTLKACTDTGTTGELVQLYRGLGKYSDVRFHLELTDKHVVTKSLVYDFSGQPIEERNVYKWTMCLPTKCTH